MSWFKKAKRWAIAFFTGGGSEIAYYVLKKKHESYRKRIYNDYLSRYIRINNTYNLGIPYADLESASAKYAKLRADQAYPDLYGVINEMFSGKNLAKTMLNILGAIAGVLLSIFPPTAVAGWVMVAGVVASVIGGISALTLQIVGIITEKKLTFIAKEVQSTAQATQHAKNAMEVRNKQITSLLIYAPYEMFPEGSLYKEDRAGSRGYQAGLEAPNPMRAMNGEFKRNEFAKAIQNTAHTKLAGNKDFDPCPLPNPTLPFIEDTNRVKENIKSQIKYHSTQIQKGFSELAENYFCFDNEKLFKEHFERNTKQRIHTRIHNYNSYSFIEQNKYYNKGELLPLFDRLNLPHELKYQGPPSFANSPLVFSSGISYDIGQELLDEKIYIYELDDTEYCRGWDFPKFKEMLQKTNTNEYISFSKWWGKNAYRVYVRNFISVVEYEGFDERAYLKAWENSLPQEKEKIKNYFNTYLQMVFVLHSTGEIANSTYILKNELENLLNGTNTSIKNVKVCDGYGVLVCKVKKELIVDSPPPLETSQDSTQEALKPITSTQLQALKQQAQDLSQPPTHFWDYYDVELMAIAPALDIPNVAKKCKQKYRVQNDDFIIYALNNELGKKYNDDTNLIPQEIQEANTLFYSLITYQAQQEQEGDEVLTL